MKNLKFLAAEYDLKLIDEKISYLETLEGVRGKIRGYYASVVLDLRKYTVKINIDTETDREKIGNFLETLKSEVSAISEAVCIMNYIQIILVEGNAKKIDEALKEAIDRTIDFLEGEGSRSGCAFCGADGEMSEIKATEVIKNESEIDFICEECHQKRIQELAESSKGKNNVKERRFLGFLGALLGSAAGGLLWVLIGGILGSIGAVGIISVIAGGLFGYTFLGGRMGAVGSLLFILATVISAGASRFAEYVMKYQKYRRDNGEIMGFMDAIRDMVDYMNNGFNIIGEIWGTFFFIVPVVLILIVGIMSFIGGVRESKGVYSVRRE